MGTSCLPRPDLKPKEENTQKEKKLALTERKRTGLKRKKKTTGLNRKKKQLAERERKTTGLKKEKDKMA